jgi:hypothetical protein
VSTSGTYPWSFVTQIFDSSQPSHGGDRKTLFVLIVVITSTLNGVNNDCQWILTSSWS